MPYIEYKEINFRPDSRALIEKINSILDDYNKQGYKLTLRQVYYQLVARAVIPNNERSYKNLGNLISDGRIAGLIDWDSIVDRTRSLKNLPHWENPSSFLKSAIPQYQTDLWKDQPFYVEVWVEKDALVDVVGKACKKFDVPYFSCRGYTSQTEMWSAAQRMISKSSDEGKTVVVIHLGDHDPSGIDMSRDIEDRLNFFAANIEFERIALTIEQISEYSPPPNPAKITDSRARAYIDRYGNESWELDALEPRVLDDLISEKILSYCHTGLFEKATDKLEKERNKLTEAARKLAEGL